MAAVRHLMPDEDLAVQKSSSVRCDLQEQEGLKPADVLDVFVQRMAKEGPAILIHQLALIN